MSESQTLLERLTEAQVDFARHHQVAYTKEILKAVVVLAKTSPYLRGDVYETALDLLDETGAALRARRLINGEEGVLTVQLQDLAKVVERKTGHSLSDFIR